MYYLEDGEVVHAQGILLIPEKTHLPHSILASHILASFSVAISNNCREPKQTVQQGSHRLMRPEPSAVAFHDSKCSGIISCQKNHALTRPRNLLFDQI